MLTGTEIAERARQQLMDLTGLRPDTVSAMSRGPDGWQVSVDMIELKRIPEASDVLATYEVTMDDDGTMLEYRRTRRYYRGNADEP